MEGRGRTRCSQWALLRTIGGIAAFGVLAAACSNNRLEREAAAPYVARVPLPDPSSPVGWVDPFIGSANNGQTHPGALVPNGLASVSPRAVLSDIVGLLDIDFLEGGTSFSGYIANAPSLYGFGLAQLSGVGCPEFGLPLLAPGTGPVPLVVSEYASSFTNEVAFPGYYGVDLVSKQVDVDLTATPRTGLLRFTFRGDDGYVLVDASNAISIVRHNGALNIVNAQEVEGSAAYGGFCFTGNEGRIYFVARFDQAAARTGIIQRSKLTEDQHGSGDVVAYFQFPNARNKTVNVQVGLSWTSIEHARMNLEAEAATFDAALDHATTAWAERLSRLLVSGGTAEQFRKFYTALYHVLFFPSLSSNVDGSYLSFGANEVVTAPTRDQYSVFSLWDTYRTLHPLLALVYPELQLAMARSLADMTVRSGVPPKWELIGDEVQMMVGDPALIVLADSYAKGLTDFGLPQIYPLLVSAAVNPLHRPGGTEYLRLGYVPMEDAGAGYVGKVWGPAATTLEYAFADWSLAQLALALGRDSDADVLLARSIGYRTLYDQSTGTLRPKHADGSFLDPFDPDHFSTDLIVEENGGAGGLGFVEGSAWHYAFMAPHDIAGLIELNGSTQFIRNLQNLFDSGRFTSFNEPDIAYPYLFNYVDGEAYRTQVNVRRIIDQDYGIGPAGLPGNDDTGTLSAWLVFSMMGIYPVTPGAAVYQIGSPVFDEVVLRLTPPYHSGREFKIETHRADRSDPYIRDMTLNGSPQTGFSLTHDAISRGGVLRIDMAPSPVR